ncbi:MAG: hypothetical protein CW338_08230, partial [Clostridiales bacterium]|nr:hypothetical protein [Clostridiales bacterium]
MKKTVLLFLTLCLSLSLLFSACADTAAVVRMEYTADWGGAEIAGLYTGEISAGVPAGFGVLEVSPAEESGTGAGWHYIGMWADGFPSGEGVRY